MDLRYGRTGQVQFRNPHDYYYSLGVLARPGMVELRWENNEEQGAWGSEGRIHCLRPISEYPPFFRITKGTGKMYGRINCNDYVANLITMHNFRKNTTYQDVETILSTVPLDYIKDFEDGYGITIKR